MCTHYTGDCGHHFVDSNGHTNYNDCSFEMNDGDYRNEPKCFELSKDYIDYRRQHEAGHIAKMYDRKTIELALDISKGNVETNEC